MKALSIWQPHASLLVVPNPVSGIPFKRHETRGRRMPGQSHGWYEPVSQIGQRIAIHAAKSLSELRWIRDGGDEDFYRAIRAIGYPDPMQMPVGAIVGTAILKRCHLTENLVDPGPFGDFSPRRWAWEMADTQPLATPIPCVGRQGFFDIPDSLLLAAAA
ncbi:MAG: hypothetical protein F8N36_14180 [Desulfovibrio sp.]|uniref:hypothetical protein n=1 Tax=Desulfovibrio sp. TaxID=885 RepID=UPI00135D11A4|nr:hypothetical protein [Desulfovibrio sp.]MTJ93987.1 hypothetical protein [Desulfovibrio sp.]